MLQVLRVVGNCIEIDRCGFLEIVKKKKQGVIVTSKSGIFKKRYTYLVSHNEFLFYLYTDYPVELPGCLDVIISRKIYSPLTTVR